MNKPAGGAQFTPLGCTICREQHMVSRTLSYDGRGINSCGMYRNRIATFQHSDDVARELGPKFAAAPAMYEAIKQVIEHRKREFLDNSIEPYCSLVAALAQAEGR